MKATIHTVSGPSGIDVRRYGRLLAKFTPKVIETEAENHEALAVVESLLKGGEGNLNAEEIASALLRKGRLNTAQPARLRGFHSEFCRLASVSLFRT